MHPNYGMNDADLEAQQKAAVFLSATLLSEVVRRMMEKQPFHLSWLREVIEQTILQRAASECTLEAPFAPHVITTTSVDAVGVPHIIAVCQRVSPQLTGVLRLHFRVIHGNLIAEHEYGVFT